MDFLTARRSLLRFRRERTRASRAPARYSQYTPRGRRSSPSVIVRSRDGRNVQPFGERKNVSMAGRCLCHTSRGSVGDLYAGDANFAGELVGRDAQLAWHCEQQNRWYRTSVRFHRGAPPIGRCDLHSVRIDSEQKRMLADVMKLDSRQKYRSVSSRCRIPLQSIESSVKRAVICHVSGVESRALVPSPIVFRVKAGSPVVRR
jgi:hypothetical protein